MSGWLLAPTDQCKGLTRASSWARSVLWSFAGYAIHSCFQPSMVATHPNSDFGVTCHVPSVTNNMKYCVSCLENENSIQHVNFHNFNIYVRILCHYLYHMHLCIYISHNHLRKKYSWHIIHNELWHRRRKWNVEYYKRMSSCKGVTDM